MPHDFRGRAYSHHTFKNGPSDNLRKIASSSRRRPSPSAAASNLGSNTGNTRAVFTRSRSPVVIGPSDPKATAKSHRTSSPSVAQFLRKPTAAFRNFLPAAIHIRIRLPLTRWVLVLSADTRKGAESLLLLASLLYGTCKLSHALKDDPTNVASGILAELHALIAISLLYLIWTLSSLPSNDELGLTAPAMSLLAPSDDRPSSPRLADLREGKRSFVTPISRVKNDSGFIWMSVPKNYRESSDDGISTGLLFGPLIAAALLYSSTQQAANPSSSLLPATWRIELPAYLGHARGALTPLEALIQSRYNLVDLSTLCSLILLFHVCASWWLESRYQKGPTAPDGERSSVPRKEGRRSWFYVLFTFGVSMGALCLKVLLENTDSGVWQHMSRFEIVFCSLFYQFTLYVAMRLAHRVFTLGELGLVCFGGTALCMELLDLTIARIWPITTPFIKTYRLPTPLVIFQSALVAGSFFTGFLLSPFLVLSRHVAQRPVRRLKFPEEKQRQRRYLALGFYVGTVLIVAGLIGTWTRVCLGKRDPWLWVLFSLLEGRRKWTRPALLVYWASLGGLSVAGWNRQLARSRRYRPRNIVGESHLAPGIYDNSALGQPSDPITATAPATPTASGALGLTFSNLPSLPNGANVSNVATDLLDAADKHVPTLSLNARRKFFHGLAVVMFAPGVAVDPAFTHLSLSAAFALFTFAEYVRYFAIYPFGAAVHVFMNEFLDHKDTGTAIVSHFYLLTGCAGSLWLEGPSQLLQYTGILALGVGDALASIVGRRIGRNRWSPTTSKTLEGSAAFTISVVLCALLLRLCGLVEAFSTGRYAAVVALSSALEALSVQNDNLTLPLYMWTMLVLAGAT